MTTSSTLGEVIPGLWIGGIDNLKEINYLCQNTRVRRWYIVTILSSDPLKRLTASILDKIPEKQNNHELPQVSIEQKIWELADEVRADFLSNNLVDVLKFMDKGISSSEQQYNEAPSACLVHCAQGVSRSAAVCAAWLISRQRKTLQQALDLVRNVRPQCSPNLGFLACLRALDQCQGDVERAIHRLE